MLCHLHEFCQHDMLYSKKLYLNKKEGGKKHNTKQNTVSEQNTVWPNMETPAETERCCINRQSMGNYL